MNKRDIIARISEKTGLSKRDSEVALNSILSAIEEALVMKESVKIKGFGKFEVRHCKPYVGQQSRLNVSILIPNHYFPAFKPGTNLIHQVGRKDPGTDTGDRKDSVR